MKIKGTVMIVALINVLGLLLTFCVIAWFCYGAWATLVPDCTSRYSDSYAALAKWRVAVCAGAAVVAISDYWCAFFAEPYNVVVHLFLATLVQAVGAGALYAGVWQAAAQHRIHPAAGIVVGAALLYAVSFAALVSGLSSDPSFLLYSLMSSVVMVACLQIKNFVAHKVMVRSARLANQLEALLASLPHVFVKVDTLLVMKGDVIPGDGTITQGGSFIDEYMVTRAQLPVWKTVGRKVFAGTTNKSDALYIHITAVGNDTILGRIIERMRHVQSGNSAVQRYACLWGYYGLPIALIAALVAFFAWFNYVQAWYALWSFCAVLAVSTYLFCRNIVDIPLLVNAQEIAHIGISMPAAQSVADAHAMTDVVIDKSLLSAGQLRCDGLVLLPSIVDTERHEFVITSLLSLVANVDSPVAQAVRARFGADVVVPTACAFANEGQGLKGIVQGHTVMLSAVEGSSMPYDSSFGRHVAQWRANRRAIFYYSLDGVVVAMLACVEPFIPATGVVQRALHALKMTSHITTPEKLDEVCSALQEQGRTIAVVQHAHTPCSSDYFSCMLSKDPYFVLYDKNSIVLAQEPTRVSTFLAWARTTMRTVYGNLAVVIILGTGLLVCVCGIYCGPMLATTIMLMVYLGVVRNSIRRVGHAAYWTTV